MPVGQAKVGLLASTKPALEVSYLVIAGGGGGGIPGGSSDGCGGGGAGGYRNSYARETSGDSS